MSVWKSDETLLSICILNFSFKNVFVWEEISNIRHSVSSPDETPRSSSKILRCASYFQLSSRCFIWWWNTASHVWYITYKLITSLVCKGLCCLVLWEKIETIFFLMLLCHWIIVTDKHILFVSPSSSVPEWMGVITMSSMHLCNHLSF